MVCLLGVNFNLSICSVIILWIVVVNVLVVKEWCILLVDIDL